MKKIIALVVVAIMMLQASAIFAENITAYNFKPEIDGVISEGEYPAESTLRVDKAFAVERGVFYNDYNANTMPEDLYFEMSYAWDADNLYLAVVAIDKSPVHGQHWDLTGGNGGTGRQDGVQLNTFVGNTFARWFMITVGTDGTVYTAGIYNQFPDTDARQNFTQICPGKGSWNENGFVFEIALPWEVIKMGNYEAEHDEGQMTHVDEYYYIPWLTSGYEIEEGLEMRVTMCYQDVSASQNRGRYANDVFAGNDDTDAYQDFVVLAGAKPVVEDNDDQGTTDTGSDDQGTTDDGTADDDQGTTDDGADTGVDTGDDAAQTFDFGVIALVAAVVSAAAMLLKKKR